MKPFQQLATALLTLALAVAVGAGAWWLITHTSEVSKSDKSTGSATVAKVVKEDDLNTVALTEDAERRLGLTLAAVEKKANRRVRVYGGEVTIPVGRTILVAAPVGGTLKAPAGGMPKAGLAIKAGQPIFQLLPLLTPDGRATLSASLAEADGQVNNAKTQLELTRIALERARRILKEGAGSQRMVDEAQAAFELATKTLDAATARRAILAKVVGDVEGGTAAPIPIDAPQDGLLRVISALPGQTVPTGAALFEVVDLSTLWVRVPLPVGDLKWLVEVVVPERDYTEQIDAQARLNVLLGALALGVALIGGIALAGWIAQPLRELAQLARRIRQGHLDVTAVPRSRDEIGVLTRAMNDMARALRDRDFIRETLGRYVSPELAQEVLRDREAVQMGGEVREVAMLMSDLRGFSELSERLGPRR